MWAELRAELARWLCGDLASGWTEAQFSWQSYQLGLFASCCQLSWSLALAYGLISFDLLCLADWRNNSQGINGRMNLVNVDNQESGWTICGLSTRSVAELVLFVFR